MASLPSWARVGQKVVCIAGFQQGESAASIQKDQILTIRSIYVDRNLECGLRFVEIVNPEVLTSEGVMERVYHVKDFRPLISKSIEDDLAIFAPLLNTKSEEELS